MASIDAFAGNAFSTSTLTGVVNKMEPIPGLIGSLNLFTPMSVTSPNVFIDRREEGLSLIATSADGSPPEELDRDNRSAVSLKTTHLAKAWTLYARELSGIRAHGSTTELMAVQAETARRFQRVRNDMELTHEHHRLGALQGKLLDADGTTVIYDYFTEFNEAEPAVVNFQLDQAGTIVRNKCRGVTRDMERSAKGAFTSSTAIHALCGDGFYDSLTEHANVVRSFLNWSAAADLREGGVFDSFRYGGITWHNYRGTDDNSAVAVPTDQALFFPVGAQNMYEKAMAPEATLDWVNTPGQDLYAMTLRDEQRKRWVKGELYSNPLYLCKQPGVLRRAVMA